MTEPWYIWMLTFIAAIGMFCGIVYRELFFLVGGFALLIFTVILNLTLESREVIKGN